MKSSFSVMRWTWHPALGPSEPSVESSEVQTSIKNEVASGGMADMSKVPVGVCFDFLKATCALSGFVAVAAGTLVTYSQT